MEAGLPPRFCDHIIEIAGMEEIPAIVQEFSIEIACKEKMPAIVQEFQDISA